MEVNCISILSVREHEIPWDQDQRSVPEAFLSSHGSRRTDQAGWYYLGFKKTFCKTWEGCTFSSDSFQNFTAEHRHQPDLRSMPSVRGPCQSLSLSRRTAFPHRVSGIHRLLRGFTSWSQSTRGLPEVYQRSFQISREKISMRLISDVASWGARPQLYQLGGPSRDQKQQHRHWQHRIIDLTAAWSLNGAISQTRHPAGFTQAGTVAETSCNPDRVTHSLPFLTWLTFTSTWHGSFQGSDLLRPAKGGAGDQKKADLVVFRSFQMKLPIFHCLPCFTEDVFFIGTGRTIHEIQQKLHTNSTNSATTSDLNGSSEIHLGKCATFDLSLPTWPNALQLYFQTSRICSIVPHQRCVAACQPLKRGQKSMSNYRSLWLIATPKCKNLMKK